MEKTFKKLIIFVVSLIIIKFLIDYILIAYVAQKWEYTGFYIQFNGMKYFFSFLVIVIIGTILSLLKEYIVNFFYTLITITFFIPFSSVFGLMDKNWSYYILGSILFFAIGFFLKGITDANLVSIKKNPIEVNNFLLVVLYLISAYTFFIMSIYNINNVSINTLLNLKEVYDVRDNVVYKLGTNYFFNWQTKVINPFLLIFFFLKKNKSAVVVISLFQIWLYLLTGHKLVLFNFLITWIIIMFVSEKFIKRLSIHAMASIAFILIIGIMEIIISKNSSIVDYFVRRVFLVPAQISYYYYEYFSVEPFRYWQDTIFYRVFRNENDVLNTSNIIGKVYFGSTEVNAVSGFLGAEYANAGIFGVLIAFLIICITFYFINKFSLSVDTKVILIIFVSPIYSLWNSAILTTILTGGMALAIIILSQIKEKKDYDI